jgi:hypothetical protein
MTELTEKELTKWKASFADMGIIYDTDDEYKEAVHNLVGYFDILIQMDLQNKEAHIDVSAS